GAVPGHGLGLRAREPHAADDQRAAQGVRGGPRQAAPCPPRVTRRDAPVRGRMRGGRPACACPRAPRLVDSTPPSMIEAHVPSVNSKTVRPGALSTRIWPPWRSTMALAMERPRPLPLGLPAAAPSLRSTARDGSTL